MFKRNKKGFTLIELLVVIAVIGLLASIVLVAVNTARTKARNAKRLSDIKQYVLATELAYDRDGEYPDTDDSSWHCLGDYSDNACWENGTSIAETALPNTIFDDFIASLPADEMIICGYGGTRCFKGYIYYCYRTGSICTSIEIRWFMEGDNQSCGVGRDSGDACTDCTYCRYP